jgi:hypothetical protein
MSELKVSLSSQTTYVTQPEQSVTLNGDVVIRRIVDIPSDKKVIVFVEGAGRIELDDLSGNNYSEWTQTDVVTAVTNLLNGN